MCDSPRRLLRHPWRLIGCAAALRTALLIVLSLPGCALYPPQDAVRTPGGLEAVMQRYDIGPLDPDSGVPLVKQTLEELEKTDLIRYYRGTTYRLTEGNRLPADWLVQTPNVWGKRGADVPFFPLDCDKCDGDFRLPACVADPDCAPGQCVPLAASVLHAGTAPKKFCVGHSDMLVDRIFRLVVSAERAVDIVLLQPPPDTRFLAALRNAVTRLAASGRPVTMRVILGDHPPDGTDATVFLRALARDIGDAPKSRLRLYVGAMRVCNGEPDCGNALSWNHAKIVAVDGRHALVGGHNMWSPDYLVEAPVHDLSMAIDGPAATDAHRFSDALWDFLCDRKRQDAINERHSVIAGRPDLGDECLSKIDLPADRPGNGRGVPVLSIGRLAGLAPVFADQSLIARDLVIGAATRTVRMVMQDVPFAVAGMDLSWPDSTLGRLASLIADRQGDVFIVLSNYGAKGPIGNYSMGVRLETVAEKMRDAVRRHSGLAEPELSALLCHHLHLAPLRFGPDATWPNDKPIGTHAKFWMVDERAFYIGSENLYPSELQEFGYIVEDRAATDQVRRDYWEPAWQWSRAAAISGDDAPSCVFSEKKTARR